MVSTSSSKKKPITLVTSDNQAFEVSEATACMSVTVKNLMEDDCASDNIPLPNVDLASMTKEIEFCRCHAGDVDFNGPKKWGLRLQASRLILISFGPILDSTGLYDSRWPQLGNCEKSESRCFDCNFDDNFVFPLCMKIKGTDIPLIVVDSIAVLVFIGMLLCSLYVLSGNQLSTSYESLRREEELIKWWEKNSAKFDPINNTSAFDVSKKDNRITNTNPTELAIVMPPINDTSAAASIATGGNVKCFNYL